MPCQCRNLKLFCNTASVKPLPPHVPAEKASKFKCDLDIVANVILEGRTTDGLQCLPYRSIEQAAGENPIIDDIMKKMKCPSYQALWTNLLKAHPGLRKTKLNVKGTREPGQAQSAAQQLLGKVPMKFAHDLHDAHPLTRRVLADGFEYYYKWDQLQKNVGLDAGKIEPQIWVKAQVGITQLGAPRNPICYQLLMRTVCFFTHVPTDHNLNLTEPFIQVGRCPTLMFYVFGSTEIGSFVLTTANGSQAAASAQLGLQRWTDNLPDAMKEAIIARRYGNSPAAVEKFKQGSEENKMQASTMFPTDSTDFTADRFTTDGFLVRSKNSNTYTSMLCTCIFKSCNSLSIIFGTRIDSLNISTRCCFNNTSFLLSL